MSHLLPRSADATIRVSLGYKDSDIENIFRAYRQALSGLILSKETLCTRMLLR